MIEIQNLGPRPKTYREPLNRTCAHVNAGLWFEMDPLQPGNDLVKGAWCEDCKCRAIYSARVLDRSPLSREVVAIALLAGNGAAAVYLLEVAAKKWGMMDTQLTRMIPAAAGVADP